MVNFETFVSNEKRVELLRRKKEGKAN